LKNTFLSLANTYFFLVLFFFLRILLAVLPAGTILVLFCSPDIVAVLALPMFRSPDITAVLALPMFCCPDGAAVLVPII
jgi:hypothetical protein